MARVVVITGGGTGIGAACARLMCAAGDRVFITGRREAPLQAVADETGATALVGDAADGEVWGQRLLPAALVPPPAAAQRGEKNHDQQNDDDGFFHQPKLLCDNPCRMKSI